MGFGMSSDALHHGAQDFQRDIVDLTNVIGQLWGESVPTNVHKTLNQLSSGQLTLSQARAALDSSKQMSSPNIGLRPLIAGFAIIGSAIFAGVSISGEPNGSHA